MAKNMEKEKYFIQISRYILTVIMKIMKRKENELDIMIMAQKKLLHFIIILYLVKENIIVQIMNYYMKVI